jgi:hypothetical protein
MPSIEEIPQNNDELTKQIEPVSENSIKIETVKETDKNATSSSEKPKDTGPRYIFFRF